MPWLGYRRVSRVGDRGERLISPELQAQRIESYASARGLEVEMLAPELDVSGGRVERPILADAIARVESGEAAGIVVAQLDRLSRMDITDALRTIRRIEDAGGQVIAVAENFDAGTPEGRLARNMFLSIGQLQLDRYKSQFASAKRRAVERGIWPTNTAPIGYRVGPERRLVPSQAAASVRRAFRERAQGAPWGPVARILGRAVSGAQRVIRNRVYLGEIRLRISGEEVVNREAHPPLIDRRLWEAAQRSQPRPPRARTEPALLAGLVRCAGCRGLMTHASNPNGWRGYRCMGQRAAGQCPSRALISSRLLDPYVERVALAAIDGLRAQGERELQRSGDLEVELRAAEDELAAFQEAISAVEVGAQRFAEGLRSRVRRVDAARAAMARVRSLGLLLPAVEIADTWTDLDVGERGQVLRGALGVVWVRKGAGPLSERVRVIAAASEPPDLPRPGRKRFEIIGVEWGQNRHPGELVLPGDDLGEG